MFFDVSLYARYKSPKYHGACQEFQNKWGEIMEWFKCYTDK